MSRSAIECRNLWKRFALGAPQARYMTLRDRFADAGRNLGARLRGHAEPAAPTEEFWALRDVSFDIAPGEVVGVIGRNGAGKSTLLKVLSRITEPTRGDITIYGRVSSLLEVGTGFNLELTGRENVFLSGSILGMKRAEIQRKFDEIVAFAEVDRFVDTAVKHYSSGMHLRLAFAVSAHLEPEILMIDEVLAVGDAAFQRKCMGKMGDVAADGRTVLFVSHNLGAVRELCTSSLVLRGGEVICRGSVVEGLGAYSQSLVSDEATETQRSGWRDVAIADHRPGEHVTIGSEDALGITSTLLLDDDVVDGRVFCIVEDGTGNTLVHQRVELTDLRSAAAEPHRLPLRVELPALWLAPGVYSAYFKFIGRRRSGADVRQNSERALLDVDGSIAGLGKAILSPKARWSVDHPVTRGAARVASA